MCRRYRLKFLISAVVKSCLILQHVISQKFSLKLPLFNTLKSKDFFVMHITVFCVKKHNGLFPAATSEVYHDLKDAYKIHLINFTMRY